MINVNVKTKLLQKLAKFNGLRSISNLYLCSTKLIAELFAGSIEHTQKFTVRKLSKTLSLIIFVDWH